MMFLKTLFLWFVNNWDMFIAALVALTAFLEAVVKLTPTKEDDGFVHRLGEFIDKLTKWVPSAKKQSVEEKKVE